LREWILAAAVLVLPTYALTQIQSGVQGGVKSGVLSGFDHYLAMMELVGSIPVDLLPTICWRATTIRGIRRIWACQPYGPP